MRRTIFIILSLFILLAAAAADSQRTRRSTKARSTARRSQTTRPRARTAPAIKVNTDSIEAVRRQQMQADSLGDLTSRAASGDIGAINSLATWYHDGHIVDQDYTQAVRLWRQAADSADVRAMAHLGNCYRLGKGVPMDSLEAARLYAKSIREGNGALFKYCIDSAADIPFAAMLIGECYQSGDGVKRDVSRAADYYSKAADRGAVAGMRNAGLCYLQSNDSAQALRYLEMGAREGDHACGYWAATLLINDDSTLARGVSMMLTAAESGSPLAEDAMGHLYARGHGVPQDPAQAAEWYRLSAEQGCPQGQWDYGIALSRGDGVPADYSTALTLMASAACNAYSGDGIVDMDSVTTGAYGHYVDGMRHLLVDGDLTAAAADFRQLSKAKAKEAPIMQALILASKDQPKPNPKKAAKMLGKHASDAEAAYYLSLINASGTPAAIDITDAITSYRKSDCIVSLLRGNDR